MLYVLWLCCMLLHILPWCVCFLCTIKTKPHGFSWLEWKQWFVYKIPCKIFALLAERHLVLLHVTVFTFIFGPNPKEIIWLIFGMQSAHTHTHNIRKYILNRNSGNSMIIPIRFVCIEGYKVKTKK